MTFTLAEKKHDTGIRSLLSEVEMPGAIRMAYNRDPDYFLGLDVMGKFSQTLVYEKGDSVKAIACRSIKPVFINGQKTDFGYLSSLRIAPDARNGIVLGRGYKKWKELHGDNRTPAYLSTIVKGNRNAVRILTSRKAGIPTYHYIGDYHVYSLMLNRCQGHKDGKVDVLAGGEVPLSEITVFLREQGRRRQFFPCLKEKDFGSVYLRDFDPGDFHVAIKGSRILGVTGAWDQTGFRRNVITGYGGAMKTFRPILNRLLGLYGIKPLPEPGSTLKTILASFICVRNDNPLVLRALLRSVCRSRKVSGCHSMLIGFHDNDPLRRAVRGFFRIPYTSKAYLVYWEEGKEFCDRIDGRVPYLELGTL